MPMTVREIIAASLPQVVEAARNVVIREPSDTIQPSFRNKPGDKLHHGTPILRATAYTNRPGKRVIHQMIVAGVDNRKKLSEGNVLVRCSCDYFTFNCEVALTKRGASSIKQSNGEKPVVRNPKMVPTPCKHLLKLLTIINKRKM